MGTLNSFLDDRLASKSKRTEDAGADGQDIHATFGDLFLHLQSDDEVADHYRRILL